MIYTIFYMRLPVAVLAAWDETITMAVNDQGRYQWTVGKKVPVVLEWINNHQHQWEVQVGPEPTTYK